MESTRSSILALARSRTTAMPRAPLWAFGLSRALALAAGVAGALLVGRVHGWTYFDPAHYSSSLGSLGNVLAAPAVRWDAFHYLRIAHVAYANGEDTAFFPLYPLLIAALGTLIGSDVLAGILISAAAFAVALVVLHRLTELELDRRAADATVLVLAFAPLSFFFTALYTESLFLALSVGAFYAARRDRFRLAAGLVALASVTRIFGVALLIPIVMMYRARGHRDRRERTQLRMLFVVLPAVALASYAIVLHAYGWGWLTPFQVQTGAAHSHSLLGPLVTVGAEVAAAFNGLVATLGGQAPFAQNLAGPFTVDFENVILLVVLALAVAALVGCWRTLPRPYGAYAAIVLVLAISSPVNGVPLKSIDRYTLVIFPLWMAAGSWAARRRAVPALVALGACLLAFYSFEFATWAWIA